MDTFPHLMSPGLFGQLQLRNRIIMPPMGTAMADPDGSFSTREIEYFAARARGGAALIMTEATQVQTVLEPPLPGITRADSDAMVPGMRAVADAVHAHGAKIAAQLTAGFGRNGGGSDDAPPVSASAVPAFGRPDLLCRELTVGEIGMIVESFHAAAGRLMRAGFDAVDIHGHTGYLIDQFLSESWNHRQDAYGGSLKNRMRFAVEIVEAVRAAVGQGVPISFRFSVDQKLPGGRTVEQAQQMALILQRAGVDALQADAGCYEAMDYVFPPYYLGDAMMVDQAAAMSQVLDIPVVAVGNLTPETAEATLVSGAAQFVASGRGLIADPDWPNKVAAGRRASVRPCIRCNQMCVGNLMAGRPLGCSVNPQAGAEAELAIVPAGQNRRIVVVGGGPAGMEAARVAAMRGHHVTVYERREALGGVLQPAAKPEFKRELRKMISWWTDQLDALGVTVRLGQEVTASSTVLLAADAVVLATGALAAKPNLFGIDNPIVLDVMDLHDGLGAVGDRVLVIGGGLSGCDAALELAERGKTVTVVEMDEEIARDMVAVNRMSLLRKLDEAGVAVVTGQRVVRIDDLGAVTRGEAGEVHYDADTVVTALGLRPNNALAVEFGAPRQNVLVAGDCVRPAKVGDAVHAGFHAGMSV